VYFDDMFDIGVVHMVGIRRSKWGWHTIWHVRIAIIRGAHHRRDVTWWLRRIVGQGLRHASWKGLCPTPEKTALLL